MTIFEYVMVMISIILGFGMTQLLRGFGKILRSERRDATLTLWTVFVFILFLQNWWAFWDLHAVTTWTQYKFVLVALIAILMFAMVELLVPMSANRETDWAEHYASVRRWFAAVGVAFALLATSMTWLLLDVSLLHPYRATQSIIIASIATGLFTSNAKALRIAPIVAMVTVITGQVIFRVLPGLS